MLERAAIRDIRRLTRHAEELEERMKALESERAKLKNALSETRDRINVLRQVARASTVGDLDESSIVLRGARLRQEAARILVEQVGVREAVHYRDWYERVTAAGFVVAGKKPLSTFLTAASRFPLVERGLEAGTYLIEPDLLRPIGDELAEARGELADLEQIVAREPAPSEALRQHRVNLLASIRRLERRVEESEDVLSLVDTRSSGFRAA